VNFAPRRVALAFIALIACAPALSACGGDESTTPNTPAGLTPSTASIYLEATVGPSTPQGKSLTHLLDRLPGGDAVIDDLISGLDQSLADGRTGPDPPTFAKTVKPWLGNRVGLFFVGADDPPDAAAVFAVDDPEAARRVAREQPDRGGGGKVSLHVRRGVIYGVDKEGQTSAYLDGYLVAGDERAVVAAIDVARDDAPSLADTGELASARRLGGPDGPLLLAQVDLGVLSQAIALPGPAFPVSAGGSESGASTLAGYPEGEPVAANPGGFGGTVLAALSVDGGAVTVDTSTLLDPAPAPSSADAGASDPGAIISDLPADSFAVAGAADVGPQLAQAVKQSLGAQLGPLAGPGALRQGLRTRLGFDAIGLAKDLGDLGVFVSRDGRLVSTGAVVSVDDPRPVNEALGALPLLISRSNATIEPLPRGLPGDLSGFLISAPAAPQPFALAFDGERLLVGYGVTTLFDAFDPGRTIAETNLVADSRKALGGGGFQPAIIVDGVGLAQALKLGLPKRQYREAAPYLDLIALVAAGSRTREKAVDSRLVATLTPEKP
jgi:hypothetical protein